MEFGLDQDEKGGVTAPEVIHTLLRNFQNNTPHVHEFACLKPEFLAGNIVFGKKENLLLHDFFSERTCESAPTRIFICKVCFLIYNFTQVGIKNTHESAGQPIACNGARAHHFHWGEADFDTSSCIGDPPEMETRETGFDFSIKCCKCLYKLNVSARTFRLSNLFFSHLHQACPTENAYFSALKLFCSIMTNSLEGIMRPIKVIGKAFSDVFEETIHSVKCFENVGYSLEEENDSMVLVPSEKLSERNFVIPWWLLFKLEQYNKILSMKLSEEAHQSIFNQGEDYLLKMFGGSYKKFKRVAEVNPFRLNHEDVKSNYSKLGCFSDMDDEIIWEVFRTLTCEKPALAPEYFDHVISIAEERQSSFLLDEIAMAKSQGEFSATDIKRAKAHFNISEIGSPPDEYEILRRFQTLKQTMPEDIGEHQTNLKLLGLIYGTSTFETFLMTGNMPLRTRARLPIGLDNIGNTCYLNSLLQYYFSVKYLRDLVLSFQPDLHDYEFSPGSDLEGVMTIDNRKVSRKELALARHFVKHLRTLFDQLATEQVRDFISPSLELAKMSLGNMEVSLRRASTASMENHPPQNSPPLDAQMGTPMEPSAGCSPTLSDYAEGKRSISPAFPSPIHDRPSSPVLAPEPEIVEVRSRSSSIDAASLVNDMAFGSQQDVSECMDHIMWQLEKAFASQQPSEERNLVKELFYGETRQVVSYFDVKENKNVSSSKTEEFSHLMINVNKASDIYSSLDEYFHDQKVELDGNDAIRELSISRAPPFLQIQLQRVQFDRATLRTYKSNEFLRFHERIYLDRYMDGARTDPSFISRFEAHKQEMNALRQNINNEAYLAGLDMNYNYVGTPQVQIISDLIASYQRKLEPSDWTTLDITDEFETGFRQDATKLRNAIEVLNGTLAQLKKNQNDAFLRYRALNNETHPVNSKYYQVEYRLHAVFMHKGSANYGHYWVYIRDWKEGVWFKFNDDHVVTVPDSDIFADTSGSTANPYYIIYISSDRLRQLVDVAPSPPPFF